MKLALRLAQRAAGRTRPNPLVGCILVRDQKIVGRGYHKQAGSLHAEPHALVDAGTLAEGATAYVTLEPCSHQGRTPPCADALIKAKVARVVVAIEDPNPLVAGRGLHRIRQAGIDVTVGVCQEEARRILAPFISWITRKRPLVTLKTAASIDGKIATRTGESQWITGPEARRRVHRLRDTHDVVMVGAGTAMIDNPQLTCRLPGGRHPIRLVVDSTLRIPLEMEFFRTIDEAPLWIAVTDRADPKKRQAMKAKGANILEIEATPQGRVNLTALMARLGALDVTSVLSEAGGILSQALLDARLPDRLELYLAPKLIGGHEASGILNGAGVSRLADAVKITHMRTRMLGHDLLIQGDLNYPDSKGAL
ncbi:MAG: bifunctional diaminohydroxyphosphoribosylaminopyrimidine deaminase/5-amino-6-(5-phosphoribosylamino)uracil reductase RibD [Magnetococcales bacterium]|nr:bifunctional diaminohydroxyphosphoribosylaminopyrimidine deaminase/5-amino-6-(5-phosphoribosylamino)uracil reductase RibD [Magnetococcales bacterium]